VIGTSDGSVQFPRSDGPWHPQPWLDGGAIGPKQDLGWKPYPDAGPWYKDAWSPSPKKDTATPPPPPDVGTVQPPGTCGNAFESEVFTLVNQERGKNGLSPFLCGPLGTKVAHAYAQVMCDQDHFDHTGPDGSSPFDRMQQGGISFQTAGENIAAGQDSPQSVMESWMNSSGHRANILGDFKYIGVGYVPCSKSWGHYWVQVFWQ
jgi:uncharacterized protein YkwD